MNATFFCNKCGASNDGSAQFCSRCGTPQNAPAAPVQGATAGAPSYPPSSYPPPSYPQAIPAPGAGYPAAPAGYPPAAGYAIAQTGVRYGGFWIRVIAFIIDLIIVSAVLLPFKIMFGLGSLAFGGLGAHGLHDPRGLIFLIFGGGVLGLLRMGASWLYESLMESSSYQATLGKMIFGMKVTDLYGNRISFGRATGRHFAKIISAVILFVGFIMVGFTDRKQGLHDMIAGTLVLKN